MHLRLLLPTEVLLDARVNEVCAEAENGMFCLLPRHIDFVTALVPGLLSYVAENGEERFVAVDEGTLVKQGETVLVSVRNAVPGESLEELRATVSRQFGELDERERQTRTALGKLEADAVRRFLEIGK